jgi:uncharacterized delta-60 repeat protein
MKRISNCKSCSILKFIIILLVLYTAKGQATQQTYAGFALKYFSGGYSIGGIAADSFGNLYLLDLANNTVRVAKYDDQALVQSSSYSIYSDAKVFSTGKEIGSDGIAFSKPSGIATDQIGNIYIADTGNHLIRKITPKGIVSTLGGSLGLPGNSDGAGSNTRFSSPKGIAVDAIGNIYVADTDNHTIRKISTSGIVTTIAGLAGISGNANGPLAAARFNKPSGVAIDSAGKIYISEYSSIRIIDPTGIVSSLTGPSIGQICITVNSKDELLVGGTNGGIYKVDSGGIAEILKIGKAYIAPTGGPREDNLDVRPNVLAAATLNGSEALTCDSNGSIFWRTGVLINEAISYTPVSLVKAPSDVAGFNGDSVQFAVSATGSSLNYFWTTTSEVSTLEKKYIMPMYINLPAVDVLLKLYIDSNNKASSNSGYQGVCVYNIGSYANSTASLTVNQKPPILKSLPETQYFPVAQTVTLAAIITPRNYQSNSLLYYQWSYNGVEIAGATSSVYTISSLRQADAGNYSVIVTEKNAAGNTAASTQTNLVVNASLVPPQITLAPAPKFVTVGASATFSVTVNGYPTPTYQWNFNGSPINGATSSSYSISSAQVTNIGLYSVTLTNSSGSLTSDEVPLTVVLADDGEWTVQSSPTKDNLWGICYASGIYAAVGENGTIITSPDGVTWTKQTSGTTLWLTSISFGNGLFIAVGDKGVILTSPNGINWITRKSTGERINAVAYGNGVYLAVGETGDIWTSADGITWAYRNAGSIGGTSTQLRGLIYVAPKFYISGANGSLQWSYDGSISNKLYSGTTDFIECIAYGRNQLVATGANGLSTSSSNGFKWNAKTIDAGYRRGVAFWNNQFIAVDNSGAIATSFEGKGWITKATKSKQNLIAITGNDTGAVAVGFGGTIIYSPAAKSAPIVQSQPSDLTEAVGGNIAFTVKASGSFPLSYQWSKNGLDIIGAVYDKLLLTNVKSDSAGLYHCTITNSMGSTKSSAAKASIISTFSDAGAVDSKFLVNPGIDKAPLTGVVQLDGKIIIGGDFVIFNQGIAQIGLARLNSDGSIDTAFKPANIENGAVVTLAIQSDGKILVGGTFKSIGGLALPYLCRLKSDGSIDVDFAPDIAVKSSSIDQVLVSSLGQIIIVNRGELLLRLKSNGSIDESWKQKPITTPNYYGGVNTFKMVRCAEQADGKIIIESLGAISTGRTTNSWTKLSRLNSDGSADASFIEQGRSASYSNSPSSLIVLPSGKIIWLGRSGGGFYAKRLLSSGIPDVNFIFESNALYENANIGIDGKFWVKYYDRTIRRFNDDGDLDLSWKMNAAASDSISFLLSLSDGGLIIGGSFTQIENTKRSYLARLNSQTNGGANLPEIQSLDPIYIQIRAGDTVTSNVSASGSPALNYSAVYSIFSGSYLSNTKTLSSTNGGFSLENVQSTGVIEFTAVSAGSPSSTRSTYIRVVPSAPVLTGLTVATQTSGSSNLVLSAAASGSDPRTYQWFKDFNPISGATQSTLSIKGTDADAGQYQLVIRNTLGTVTSTVLPLNFSAPTITVQPNSITTAVGQSTTLSVSATGYPSPVYQWRKGGTNIAGATSANYTISNPSLNDAGSYSVVVSNGMGSLTSSSALLTVGEASIISNVSVRTSLALGQTLIVGAVVSGGSKDIMVRAAGPALNQFGLIGSEDPRLELYTTGITPLATNDDWPSTMSPVFASVGAFGFPAGSKDSALVQSINGSFTVQARSTSTGVILVEAYDLSTKPTPRLINISARNQVGTGSDILIAGFAITGTGTKRLLIRGVGPGLGQFGVTDFLLDPKLQVFDSTNTEVGTNDNWDPTLTTISQSVGAFALPSLSKDAALVVNLKASSTYTVWVSGSDGGTGNALIEVYELP